tara:strand:- start:104 stop:343 length:240 start_codon:yes stop_codon:yes gene_type:complete
MNHDYEELTQSIIRIVKNITRYSEVNRDSSTQSLSQWDSLAYMSILSEVELKYEVEVTEENINDFDSIESIVNIVQKNQ